MKKKRFSILTLALMMLLTAVLTLGAAFGALWGLLGPEGLGMAEAMVLINARFVGEHDITEATDGAMRALIQGLGDRWSYYMDAESYQRQKESKDNAYVGIGATIRGGPGGLVVLAVAEGGPSDQAGIRAGDLILSVDGVSMEEAEGQARAGELTRGPGGSTVVLEVRSSAEGTERTLTVVRGRVEEHPVSYRLLSDGTGLVTIKNFNSRCASEAESAVEDLLAQGAARLVFDVRNNGGGYLDELTKLLDYLLPEGAIFQGETKTGRRTQVTSDSDCVELPMAVLVNENTYSAAELFAAQLREMDRAVAAGAPTTGKGFSQQTFPLLYGGAINISTAKYFTGGGVSLIGTGFTPDMVVELTETEQAALKAGTLAPERDPQLQAAISLLS